MLPVARSVYDLQRNLVSQVGGDLWWGPFKTSSPGGSGVRLPMSYIGCIS